MKTLLLLTLLTPAAMPQMTTAQAVALSETGDHHHEPPPGSHVPEPQGYALLGSGLLLMAALKRRLGV